MSSEPETIIARCNVVASAEDADYRQALRCGRHELLADERPVRGGADAGPMPFEYLLGGLGACTSITLRMYAQRKGWNIGKVSVSLALRRGKNGSRIERRVALSAPLSQEQQAKLADICEKTPVTLVVKSGIDLRTTIASDQPVT
ncbi:MAG: OsmC family protein [Betaproteobacteria bacterium]|nr:MAG: OsmC family protein [Betaproteobacteria bacterium]TMH46088.1 MAG: OsmC family protein [Betaproteobacteria bacterium]